MLRVLENFGMTLTAAQNHCGEQRRRGERGSVRKRVEKTKDGGDGEGGEEEVGGRWTRERRDGREKIEGWREK